MNPEMEEAFRNLNSNFAMLMDNPTLAIEQSTNLEKLLLGHAKDIQFAPEDMLPRMPRNVNFDHLHSLQQPLPSFDDLRPQDRLECSALATASTPNQVLWGKYLLCQTISPGSKVGGFKVVVTDPKGTSAMELALYNYSSVEKSVLGVDLDDILPPGSFLVLKNPWFVATAGDYMLRCDNPAEVELVSRKRVEAKFPDLEWNGEVEKRTIHFFGKKHFWISLEDDEAAFVKLKGLGNKGFVDKRFSDAIRFYDMALDYCTQNRESEAMIRSNKSAALLALGCFNTALKCAEFALEVDPGNEKYNYRKTKALIGLGKYEEGLSFLGGKFEQFPSLSKNKDCKNLLDNVKFLASRINIGPTESQLYSLRKQASNKNESIPEFFGPLAVSQIEGKGRGLVATEDIHPGQILICKKAFCCQAPPSSSNQGSNILLSTPMETLVGKIANKLAFDPELGPAFYNLTAGSELGHLEAGDWKNGQVDMKRIYGIVKTNSFGLELSETGIVMKPDEPAGLWISLSLLNHSCSEFNAVDDLIISPASGYREEWFQWLTAVAIAEIKKGEEVTLPYVSPINNYNGRQQICKLYGFTCTCKLCKLEASEPNSVRNERERILQSLDELEPDCGPEEIKAALKGVEKLISFRKDNVPLNFPLLYPQIFRLEEILVEKDRFYETIWLLNRMFEVADASPCWYLEGTEVAMNLAGFHALLGDKKLTKEWTATLKRMTLKMYGRLEDSWLPLDQLKEQFGIDFSE